jgi:hypothetical protein
MMTPVGRNHPLNKSTAYAPHQFFDYVLPKIFGDDVLCGIKSEVLDKFNNITYRDFVVQVYGMDFTSSDKSSDLKQYLEFPETSFLKRNFVFREDLSHYVAPLSLDSIMKSIVHYLPSKNVDAETQLVESCISASRELFFHLKEPEFKVNRNRFIEILAHVTGFDATSLSNQFPTFSDIRESLYPSEVNPFLGRISQFIVPLVQYYCNEVPLEEFEQWTDDVVVEIDEISEENYLSDITEENEVDLSDYMPIIPDYPSYDNFWENDVLEPMIEFDEVGIEESIPTIDDEFYLDANLDLFTNPMMMSVLESFPKPRDGQDPVRYAEEYWNWVNTLPVNRETICFLILVRLKQFLYLLLNVVGEEIFKYYTGWAPLALFEFFVSLFHVHTPMLLYILVRCIVVVMHYLAWYLGLKYGILFHTLYNLFAMYLYSRYPVFTDPFTRKNDDAEMDDSV